MVTIRTTKTIRANIITWLRNLNPRKRFHAKKPQQQKELSNKSKKRRWSQGLVFSILPFVQQKKSAVVVIPQEEGYDTKEESSSSCASTEVAENEHHQTLTCESNDQDQTCSDKSSLDCINETTDTFVFDYIVDDDGEILIREDETVGTDPSYVTEKSLETAYELEWDGLKYPGSIIDRIASESTEESEEDDIIITETDGNIEVENINDKNQQVGTIWNSIFFCNTSNPRSERIARRITGYCTMNEFGFGCGSVYCVSFKTDEIRKETRHFTTSSSSLAQQHISRRKTYQTNDGTKNPQSDNVSVLSEDDDVNSIIDNEHEFEQCDTGHMTSINSSKKSPPPGHEHIDNTRGVETADVGTETILLAEMKLKTKSEMEDSNRSSRTEVARNTSNTYHPAKQSPRRRSAVILQHRASIRQRQ